MKKNNLTVGVLLTSLLNYAQPVIDSSNLSPLSSETLTATANGFSPGAAGANQTWDFSGLQLTANGSNTIEKSAVFPTANLRVACNGNPLNANFYYRQTVDKIELVGEDFTGIGTVPYPDPKTLVEFPYAFGQIIRDSYTIGDKTVSFISTYDAYGALLLPFGKYPNVIRQKIVENGQTNYIWFNVNPFFPILQTALEDGTIGIIKNTAVGNAR